MMRVVIRLLMIAAIAWVAWRAIQALREGGGSNERDDRDDRALPAAPEPPTKQQLDDWLRSADREIEQARHWSDSEVALGVEEYTMQRATDEGLLLAQLAQRPERASQHALRMLQDPAQLARLRRRKGRETGVQRACRLIARHPDAAAVPFLCEVLDGPEPNGRDEAAQALAATPGRRALAELQQRGALRADHPCCEHALRGLVSAGRDLPRDELLMLWSELPDDAFEARRLTLRLLAGHRDERDRALFLRVAEADVACGETAAQCLRDWRGA